MDWLSTIHLLGAAQGLFLAAVLASRHRNSVPNRLLALLMAGFVLELLSPVAHHAGLDRSYPWLIGLTLSLPILYAPLFYLYARTLSEPGHWFHRRYLLHFVPFLLVMLYLLPFILAPAEEKLAFLANPESSRWARRIDLTGRLNFVYGLLYLLLTLGVLHRHRERVKANFSALEGIQLSWLWLVTGGGIVTWCVALGFEVADWIRRPTAIVPDPSNEGFVLLGVAGFVYVIGYAGLRQQEIFAPTLDRPAPGDLARDATRESNPIVEPLEPAPARKARYARSGLQDEAAAALVQRLNALMETDQPWRRPSLTLQELSRLLDVSPHNLSEAINTQLDTNFFDLVNGYRVREAQRRLGDSRFAHLTVLAIGLDAGFNSKSSFNAVFKAIAGVTPSEFRRTSPQN